MSPTYQAPRGAADVLPQDQPTWKRIVELAQELATRFGYQRIDTPAFEQAGLFVRSVGAGTDIVEKEMYTFQDRGGEEMTLRPEGTAPVCRAYLEHGMHKLPQPVRLYYIAPIFRYERPQAGRYRQHHQFGYEALGDSDPALDAEVIELGWRLFEGLGLKGLRLRLNSIGDRACRPAYLETLRAYYQPILPQLCRDCNTRFQRNTLRLLDCKNPHCQARQASAPRSVDHLCQACRDHWQSLLSYMDALKLPYEIEHKLVRGLDYYTRTVFEVQPQEEGGQSTIGGGGRYDSLIEELGGPPTPGVGFATGIERIVRNLQRQGEAAPEQPGPVAFVAYMGEAAKARAVALASELRRAGISATAASGGKSLKAQMRQAGGLKARYALIIGDEEMKAGTVMLRDLVKGEQHSVAMSEIARELEQG